MSTTPAMPLDRSRRPSPMDPQSYSSLDRPLNVTDALTYLDAVKVQFQDQPDVYNHFLDIMKEFKNEQIDTPGVIRRVSHLFNGHPSLIQGFNTFLPVGYRIECSTDPFDANFITVTTPSGTTLQTTNNGPGRALSWSTQPAAPVPRHELTPGYTGNADNAPLPVASPDPRSYGMDGQAIEPAVQYVQKIKQRCDPETYRQFLDILSRYHHKPDTIDEEEVSRQIAKLFKDAPDLRADFRVFMPDRSQQLLDDTVGASHARDRDREKSRRGKLDAVANSMSNISSSSLPQKRKRKPAEKERERERERDREKEATPVGKALPPPAKKPKHAPAQDLTPLSYNPKHVVLGGTSTAVPSSPRRGAHATLTASHTQHTSHLRGGPRSPDIAHHAFAQQQQPLPTHPHAQFFDRVKRALDNRDLYNEFLKLANLFAQDYIDTARLVKESRNFLGETELYTQFREILGWDERREREEWGGGAAGGGWGKVGVVGVRRQEEELEVEEMEEMERLASRPGRVDLAERYGSYRRVSANEANVACSGRDEMCRSVLNDEWVSHPTWTSEDSGFVSQRKNIYEEALHRSEEERHEYDFHIDAIVRTINMLEPINAKISLTKPEDRAGYVMKPNLGGQWKAIHTRVLKKIYGREAGMDVVRAVQEEPGAAVPVVLGRLKAKEAEWKRAQREWNRVWRDVDARNFAKSLDWRGVGWKGGADEGWEGAGRVRWQLAFEFGDGDEGDGKGKGRERELEDVMSLLQDVVKLTFSFLDRTQGQLGALERKRIENFVRAFVPLFFGVGAVEFNEGLVHQETVVEREREVAVVAGQGDGETSDGGEDESVATSVTTTTIAAASTSKGRNGRKHATTHSSGDLRKKLLKSEQAKSASAVGAAAAGPSSAALSAIGAGAGRKTRGGGASPAVSRFASPVISADDVGMGMGLGGGDLLFALGSVGVGANGTEAEVKRSSKISNVFFTNTAFYALLRLVEILYSRLKLFKSISAELAVKAAEKEKGGASSGMTIDKKHHYDILLGQCEALFTNELDQQVFEDQTRAVFGYKESYKIFTVDKVIGAIIKQAQAVIADPKSQELLELLKRERAMMAPTMQDRINYRHLAENILGPDENVFRIDWLSEPKTITIQLIGKDDATFDDSEALSGRWQTYIDAYVSGDSTDGVVPGRIKRPYLRRNLPSSVREAPLEVSSQDGLEIKVCLRTYRLFYVSRTEDVMWKFRGKEEMERHAVQLAVRNGLRRRWMGGEVDALVEAAGKREVEVEVEVDAVTDVVGGVNGAEVGEAPMLL
ncbi:hypothetical protein GALMADRAFT_281285 [Galerina marginata CBS 339.88]|uniref:Histone deacetylase interacting domain-containing protein n=1 Tax=Galerina marginata (strain CBS 339.88) TaxID=685588 RepID=A0A067SXW5_GALM3|nr:hypothetical protein GALMADRAFT_281285 [Galerina marginata CBS 339.88]